MADIFQYEAINIDLKQNYGIGYDLECHQNDLIVLNFIIRNYGEIVDLTNYLVELRVKRSDGSDYIQGGTTGITKGVNGNLKIVCKDSLTNIGGVAKGELRIWDSARNQTTTRILKIDIKNSALDVNRNLSQSTITVMEDLNNILNNAYDLQNDFENKISNASKSKTDLETIINTANTTKINLESSNTTATTTKNDLTTLNTNAQATKTDLTNLNTNAINNAKTLDTANTLAQHNIEELNKLGDVTDLAVKVQTNTNNIDELNLNKTEILSTIGDEAMGTTATTLKGAIAEVKGIADSNTTQLNESANKVKYIDELKADKIIVETLNDKFVELDNSKATESFVTEQISNAQLTGASIDTSNFAYNSDIENLNNIYENIGNYLDYTNLIDGEYWNNSNKAVVLANYFRSGYIKIKPNRKMIQRITSELYENYGCIFDKNKNLISTIKDIATVIDAKTITYTLPNNANFIIISGFGAEISTKQIFHLLDCKYYSDSESPKNIPNIPINKLILNPYFDKFKNKTVIFSGDSICYGANWRSSNTYISPENNTGWASIFKEEHPSCNVLGYGIGGTCITKIDGRTDSILERIGPMESNADYVIFEGGINDCWNNVPLGALTDTWLFTESEVTFDEKTFYGALESLIRKSILKWKGAKIGFILTHYIKTGVGTQGAQVIYMNAIKKVCDKWGIPYCDCFSAIGTCSCLTEINTTYFQDGDYTHPNELFYRKFYAPKVSSFVENM